MKTLKTIIAISLVAVACAALKPSGKKGSAVKNDTMSAYAEAVSAQHVENVVAMTSPGEPDTTAWVAPEEARQVKNPFTSNEETIADGMAVYKRNCRSCHGRNGDGQGVGAADCTTPPASFLTEGFKKQTDGAIFWKINTGRNDMKPYKDEIEEEDIWKVIIYIKSLKAAE